MLRDAIRVVLSAVAIGVGVGGGIAGAASGALGLMWLVVMVLGLCAAVSARLLRRE